MIYHFHIQVPYDYLWLRKKKKNSFPSSFLEPPQLAMEINSVTVITITTLYCYILYYIFMGGGG